MLTIQSVVHSITDPGCILGEMKAILRKIDPEYPGEEAAYTQALQALQARMTPEKLPEAMALLALQEQALASDLLFLVWNGLHLNLDCFYHPASRSFLLLDPASIHQEETMQTMPAVRRYRNRVDAFCRSLTGQEYRLFTPFTAYYAYLQTAAYKLAHYFGFLLGDALLPAVVPGYVPDHAATEAYTLLLHSTQNWDIRKLRGG